MRIPLRSRLSRYERKKRRYERIYNWHRGFALLPKVIPEEKHDSIVVPRHLLWLEPYERRKLGSGVWFGRFEHRTYRSAPTLKELVNQ